MTNAAIRIANSALIDKGKWSKPCSGTPEGAALSGRKSHANTMAVSKVWKSFVSPVESEAAADPSKLTHLKKGLRL